MCQRDGYIVSRGLFRRKDRETPDPATRQQEKETAPAELDAPDAGPWEKVERLSVWSEAPGVNEQLLLLSLQEICRENPDDVPESFRRYTKEGAPIPRLIGIRNQRGGFWAAFEIREPGGDMGGEDPNERDDEGMTALMRASRDGVLGKVRDLLRRGADADARDGVGRTALFFAAQYGYAEVAGELIAAGADPNARDDTGETALIIAAYFGHVGVVKELIAVGVDMNAVDDDGGNALGLVRVAPPTAWLPDGASHEEVGRLLEQAGARAITP